MSALVKAMAESASKVAFEVENEPRDESGRLEGRAQPLIPTGRYAVEYVKYENWFYLGKRPKMTVTFRVIQPGDHYGVEVCRYYNLKSIKKGGGFTVGHASKFWREYVALFGLPVRLDRIPMSAFKGEWLNAHITEVKTGPRDRPIPEPLWYSVIEHLEPLEDE